MENIDISEDLMSGIVWTVIIVSIFCLYYIYDGYGRVLDFFHWLFSAKRTRDCRTNRDDEPKWPNITIIVPIYNEQDNIATKIENLLSQDYPPHLMDVLVVNDGSTDNTDAIVRSYSNRSVKLDRTSRRVGKSLAQNHAVEQATGEILVLTDAALIMEPGCLKSLILPFSDPDVGCTTGELLFQNIPDSDSGKEHNLFWRYELKLRRLESDLGWLAVAGGALMAVRKSLWVPLEPWYGDDCVIPLDILLQGKRAVYVPDAKGSDETYSTFAQEFCARARMIVRNWQGTFSRPQLLIPWKYPRYTFSLYSHKILRWLSPLFALTLGVGVLLRWLHSSDPIPLLVYTFVLLLSLLGIVTTLAGIRVPVLSTLASLAVANGGMAWGLLQVVRGKKISLYQNP